MENYNIHFNEFATSGDVQAALDAGTLVKPYVALVGGEVDINGIDISPIDYSKMPLTLEILNDGGIRIGGNWTQESFKYRINGGEVQTGTTQYANINNMEVHNGDIIEIWASFTQKVTISVMDFDYTPVMMNVYGNVMSLIYGENFESATTIPQGTSLGDSLFYRNYGLVDASNLILPATSLTSSCYGFMFYECRNLTSAPALPATVMMEDCYHDMFRGCTSLTTAPALPATTLALRCYQSMFDGCTSLTTAPELPAAHMVERCYHSMFSGCANINYLKCLAIDWYYDPDSEEFTTGWLNGVSATGTFVKAAGVSNWGNPGTYGSDGIPAGWTVVDA